MINSNFIILTDSSLVLGFIDQDFDTKLIFPNLKTQIIEAFNAKLIELPDDWYLYFRACYTNGRRPLASKNKIGSYPSDKMKNITIVIPIPIKTEISWGVNPEQHIYGKDHYDTLMKNFWELGINFNQFSNRQSYITACLKAGITKVINEGFTVGGMKIKVKNFEFKNGY